MYRKAGHFQVEEGPQCVGAVEVLPKDLAPGLECHIVRM